VVWCKLEFLNPSGSAKDRIARYMLEKAWRRGQLSKGSWVVEASSGSTSMALALACAQLDLRFLAVMPEGVSNERVLTIRAYGGEVLAIPKEAGMAGAIARAEQEARERDGLATRQFENPDNPEAHRLGTALEILSQIPGGRVDAVVSGVGTGGTLVGLMEGCRQGGCHTRPFVARPLAHGFMSDLECCSFSARIPGVLDGFSRLYTPERLPGLKVLDIDDEVALQTTRDLIHHGFPVGPSSGLNYSAAVQAAQELAADSYIVTVFPDRMDRYFSTELFQPFRDQNAKTN
jgi:cysteine synthase A